MADEEDVSEKIRQRCVIEFCVKKGVMKHLKCYGKHMVVKHLAVLQYFSGGGTSKTVTSERSTKHVLASAVL